VPQVEGVNFGVVCPHWPNGFNVVLIVCGAIQRVKCLLRQNLLKICIAPFLVVCSLHLPKIIEFYLRIQM